MTNARGLTTDDARGMPITKLQDYSTWCDTTIDKWFMHVVLLLRNDETTARGMTLHQRSLSEGAMSPYNQLMNDVNKRQTKQHSLP